MKTIPVSEFKKHCTQILRKLPQEGEPLVITNRSTPIATVTPTGSGEHHPAWGAMRGTLLSMAEDFNEPEGDDDWEAGR